MTLSDLITKQAAELIPNGGAIGLSTQEKIEAAQDIIELFVASLSISTMKRYDVATTHRCGQPPRGEMVEAVNGEFVAFDNLCCALQVKEGGQ